VDPQDAAMFRVAAYTGLRLGELPALRWADVDFEKRLLHVRRSYTPGRRRQGESADRIPKRGISR
jgi:integrase